MTIFLLYTAPATLIVLSISYIIRVHKSLQWISSPHAEKKKIMIKKIAILLPVYNEVDIIDDTVNFFNKLSQDLYIDVYYITTSKEGGSTHNKTEQKIINNINHLSHVIHYPKKYGAKASQINYAIDHIHNTYDYIAIFDADSRPDINALRYVQNDDTMPDIYQMPSVYCRDVEELSLLEKANAIFQTRWTLGYEIHHWREWQKKYQKPPLMYTVGHGLFISSKLLQAPLFREDTIAEDIWFGYISSGRRRTLKLIPFVDYCSVPPNTPSLIKQTARWFSGELRMISLKEDIINIRNSWPQSYLLIIRRYFEIFLWPFGPILVIISLIYALAAKDLILLSGIVIGAYLYVVTLHKNVSKKVLSRKPTLQEYFALLIKSLANCLGPLLGIYQFIWSKISKKEIVFTKTTR